MSNMSVQKNKLGVTNFSKLEQIENQLVKSKLDVLNSDFMFGQNQFDVTYLQELHNFLFGDLYYEEDLAIRSRYTVAALEQIDAALFQLSERGMNQDIDCAELSTTFESLWELQLFHDGNTRTLWGFLKTYIEAFQLPMELSMTTDELSMCGDVRPYQAFKLSKKKVSRR